jgi:hypothetical protein
MRCRSSLAGKAVAANDPPGTDKDKKRHTKCVSAEQVGSLCQQPRF